MSLLPAFGCVQHFACLVLEEVRRGHQSLLTVTQQTHTNLKSMVWDRAQSVKCFLWRREDLHVKSSAHVQSLGRYCVLVTPEMWR